MESGTNIYILCLERMVGFGDFLENSMKCTPCLSVLVSDKAERSRAPHVQNRMIGGINRALWRPNTLPECYRSVTNIKSMLTAFSIIVLSLLLDKGTNIRVHEKEGHKDTFSR